jgi:hypothetical protein
MIEAITLDTLIKAMGVIAFLVLMLAFVRVINGENDLEWWHLVSTRAADGSQYADWNKIGQGLGVVLCVWLPAVYVYSPKMEAVGLAAVMGVALLYLGGVSGYAANLRAKRGSRETVTEPAAGPVPMKTTVTETPPIK